MTTLPHTGQPVRFGTFATWAALWLACAYGASRGVAATAFGAVVTYVFVLALPMVLYRLYAASVIRAGQASYYWKGTLRHRLITAWHVIMAVITIFLATVGAFWMLLQFATYTNAEWLVLVVMVPAYWLVFRKIHHLQSGQLKKRYVLIARTNLHARWLSVLIISLLYAALACVFFKAQNFSSLSEAVVAARTNMPEHAATSTVELALRFITFSDAVKVYLAGISPTLAGYLPLALVVLNGVIILYGAGEAFSCFAVPAVEFRRVLGPLTDQDTPPPVSSCRIAINAAVFIFIPLFIYVPIFAQVEEWTRMPQVAEIVKKLEVAAERIDDRLYLPGTVAKIEVAKIATLGKLNVSRAVLEGQVDRAFDRMEGRVDAYLDWYYSLTAEYTRLLKLMTGKLDAYMEKKLVEQLQGEAAFAALAGALQEAMSKQDQAFRDYQNAIRTILKSNRLGELGLQARVIKSVALGDISFVAPHIDAVSFNQRMAGESIGGAVGAGVTIKLASKGVFKQAAKAVLKVATSKASAAASGAVTGAAVGSVIPGIGTVVGGVLGGLLGGVVMDKALLELEEVYSRKEFRKELVEAINRARTEMKAGLRGAMRDMPNTGKVASSSGGNRM